MTARVETRAGRFLIGADGARSDVRRSLGIEFTGFTWPDRFLVVSTPFDFYGAIEGLAPVSYVADPERWRFLLQTPGLWRVMFPVAENESDETALTPTFAQALMATVVPGITSYEIAHTTLYKVHQRVAKTMRLGSAFLAGDAAHINNPLGGMGMNGGIHDAMNLTTRLAEVWHGRADSNTLDLYDRERRLVTLEYIDQQTIQNKRNLESDGVSFKANLEVIAADPNLTRDYLMRVSMITWLKRAKELGAQDALRVTAHQPRRELLSSEQQIPQQLVEVLRPTRAPSRRRSRSRARQPVDRNRVARRHALPDVLELLHEDGVDEDGVRRLQQLELAVRAGKRSPSTPFEPRRRRTLDHVMADGQRPRGADDARTGPPSSGRCGRARS